MVVYVVEAIDDVTHNLVTCALVLAAGDLKSARLEDFDANVWVALHAKPELHLMRELPLGVLNLATADRYHIARIVLVLIRQPHNPLVALRKHIRTWARAKRHADKQTEHSEYKGIWWKDSMQH